jgi:hypothetical protein
LCRCFGTVDLDRLTSSIARIDKHRATHLEASKSGDFIAVACDDGSVHIFSDSKVALVSSDQEASFFMVNSSLCL